MVKPLRTLYGAVACLVSLSAVGQTQLRPPKPDRPIAASPGIELLSGYLRGRALTIDQAVRLSLITNHSLALATATLYSAQGNTSLAYAALNPTLGGAVDVLRLNDSVANKTLVVDDPKNLNNPIGAEVVNQNIQQQLFSITAQVPIDISGTLRVATQQAKFQEIAYRMDVDRTRNQIVADVKAAFYDALRAGALQKVAEEDLKNSQDRLKDAQSKFQAQVVTKFDVLRAQTDVAAAQQNVIVAKNTAQTDLAVLNLVMGIDVTTQLRVTEEGAIVQPEPLQPNAMQTEGSLGPEFDSELQEALRNRPEIKEAVATIEAAQKGITLARRSVLPQLNLSWSYLYAPNAGGSTPLIHTWEAQAVLSVPMFDGGVAHARRQEARGNVAGAEVFRRQAVDQITLEAEQSYLSVNEARLRIDVANQSLKEANAAFDLAKVRYVAGVSAHAGISPLLELSDAQSALTLAETNQVNALYDYNSARARLDRALGRFASQH
jgi:outer membrane protein TolC